jgi:tRNA uridine 5-carboxymethylaminomethyl modification enzyme
VDLMALLDHTGLADDVVAEAPGLEAAEVLVGIELRYAGYLDREYELVEKMSQLESWQIPADLDYQKLANITIEARQKLGKIRPDNLGQASRISGVSPADISVLMVLLKKHQGARPRPTVEA